MLIRPLCFSFWTTLFLTGQLDQCKGSQSSLCEGTSAPITQLRVWDQRLDSPSQLAKPVKWAAHRLQDGWEGTSPEALDSPDMSVCLLTSQDELFTC